MLLLFPRFLRWCKITPPAMWKQILFVVLLFLGLAGFCAIPFVVGVSETFSTIGQVGWPFLGVYILLGSLTMLVPAGGWWILMRAEGIPVSLGQAVKANLMGMPLNFFTPSAYLGAEPLKVFYISKVTDVQKRRVLATIVANKVQELAALVLLMLVAAIVFVWRTDTDRTKETALVIGTAVLVVLMVLLAGAFIVNAQPSVKIINFLARFRIGRRRLARLRTKAEEVERIIHSVFVHRWKTFVFAQAITSLSALSILARPIVFFAFLADVPMIPFKDACMVYVIVNFINTITFIPGGFGLQEFSVVGYLSTTPVGDHNAAAFMIVNRIADFFYITLGSWLIAHYGLTSVAKGVAKGTEKIEERDLLEAAEAEERGGSITRRPGRIEGAPPDPAGSKKG